MVAARFSPLVNEEQKMLLPVFLTKLILKKQKLLNSEQIY